MDKNTIFSKVEWVADSSFCIVSDKDFNGQTFPHFVFIFDSAGHQKCEPVKVKTAFNIQSDYCFSLGTSMFFLDGGEQQEGAAYEFKIMDRVSHDGVDHDEHIRIFYISKSKENKKLNSESYSFKVYRGTDRKKAVLAYNNDYKDPYNEGFRYRILDAEGKLTDEDTLNLPYLDKACSITDVIYDDGSNKIFLLCNLYSVTGKDEKKFRNSFITEYDLANKTYREISKGIPEFSKNKAQHLCNENIIAFSGLNYSEATENGWTAPIVAVNKNTFDLITSASLKLDPKMAAVLFGLGKYILPVNFVFENDSTYTVAWMKFFTIYQMNEIDNGNGSAVAAATLLFGLTGALITAAATSASSIDYGDFEKMLWISYSARDNSVIMDTANSILRLNKYHAHGYTMFLKNNSAFWLMNKATSVNNRLSTIYVSPVINKSHACDSLLYNEIANGNLNIIYPGSLMTQNRKNYFVGEFNPDFYFQPMRKVSESNAYFLLEIE